MSDGVSPAASVGNGRKTIEEVFRDESGALYRTLRAFTGGRMDVAEEATAEAFARAVAFEGELRDPAAWVYRVGFRVAIDELRREGRRAEADKSSMMTPPTEPDGIYEVMEALRRLSPNQRAAVVLRHVLGFDSAEVADRMGITRATVFVHLFRARSRLAQLLGEEVVD